MSQPEDSGGPYQVHISGVIAKKLRQLQRQAAHEGRGEQVLAALRHIYERLQKGPNNAGEPLYRLASLRMEVRTIVVRPLGVHFAVCEDHPLVFFKGGKLLSRG
jgi:hypothetical protein